MGIYHAFTPSETQILLMQMQWFYMRSAVYIDLLLRMVPTQHLRVCLSFRSLAAKTLNPKP